jgi:hypothetical protein
MADLCSILDNDRDFSLRHFIWTASESLHNLLSNGTKFVSVLVVKWPDLEVKSAQNFSFTHSKHFRHRDSFTFTSYYINMNEIT